MTRREAVLRWVNRQRAVRGLDPLATLPKGILGNCHDCTLARGLEARTVSLAPPNDASANGGYYRVDSFVSAFRGRMVDLPIYVGAFGRAFDAGRYPDLIEKDPS